MPGTKIALRDIAPRISVQAIDRIGQQRIFFGFKIRVSLIERAGLALGHCFYNNYDLGPT